VIQLNDIHPICGKEQASAIMFSFSVSGSSAGIMRTYNKETFINILNGKVLTNKAVCEEFYLLG
jgi:hypothetical protein